MLKGHVFAKQIFGNPIFALFINTFLNGVNGVSNNYKNGMSVSYSGSNVTINSGAVCIQGRFLEEDTYTTISAGTDSSYCKLVIEINLDLENTKSELNQASYKIVKSSSSYPSLTQTNIVKTNSGIYQYELARFRTSSGGITNFQDMRTFLDFDSIYNAIQTEYQTILQELEDELTNVKNGSAYKLKEDFAVVEGTQELNANNQENIPYTETAWSVNYPDGFNQSNTIVLAFQGSFTNGNSIGAYGSRNLISADSFSSTIPRSVSLSEAQINLFAQNPKSNTANYEYKLILMKY